MSPHAAKAPPNREKKEMSSFPINLNSKGPFEPVMTSHENSFRKLSVNTSSNLACSIDRIKGPRNREYDE